MLIPFKIIINKSKVVILPLFLGFILLFTTETVRAESPCIFEPAYVQMKDFCQDSNEIFTVKVPRESLKDYYDYENKVVLETNSACIPEPHSIKITTDPNYIIFKFPSGDRKCLGFQNETFIVRVNVEKDTNEICRDNLQILPYQPSCKIEVIPKPPGIGDVNSTWQISVNQVDNSLYVSGDMCVKSKAYNVKYPKNYDYVKEAHLDDTNPYTTETIIKKAGKWRVEVISSDSSSTLLCSVGFEVARFGETPVPTPTVACESPYQCERKNYCLEYAPISGSCQSGFVCCVAPTPTDTPDCYDPMGPCQKSGSPCIYSECKQCSFCKGSPTPLPPIPSLAPLCEQLSPEFIAPCKDCIENQGKIWSAVGCLPTDFEGLLKQFIFPIGIGFAGAVAFLYFLYGAFIILTSAGNPEKIAQAKEIIISSLSGLLLIIFSIFLLRVIGVDILKIPGFE